MDYWNVVVSHSILVVIQVPNPSLQVPSNNLTESFIHSGYFYNLQRLFKSTITQRRSRHSTDTVSEFRVEALQATASEGLAKGSYVADRARAEPTTLLTIGVDSTNEPPRPTM